MKLHFHHRMILAIMIGAFVVLAGISVTKAAEPIKLGVPIGKTTQVKDAIEYINIFYDYFLKIISYLAMLMILFGGIRWMTAAGNSSLIGSARQTIISALIGLILAYTSVLILRFVNISLVELRDISVPPIISSGPSGLFAQPCPKGTDISGKSCGDIVEVKDGEGKVKSTCVAVFDTCGGDYCLPVGQSWKCNSFQGYCEEVDKNACETADEKIFSLYGSEDLTEACAKNVRGSLTDKCIWGNVLTCDDTGSFDERENDPAITYLPNAPQDFARASCVTGDDDSPCNDNGQPEDCSSIGVTTCSDKGRAVVGADCICCKKIDGLDCRDRQCNGDEAVVSKDRCGGCVGANQVCCAELVTKDEG